MTKKDAIAELDQMIAEYLAKNDPEELNKRLKEKFSKMLESNIPEELKKSVQNMEEELNKASGVNLTYMSEKKHGKDMKKIDPKTHMRGNLIDKIESGDVGAGSMGSSGMNLTPGQVTSGLGKPSTVGKSMGRSMLKSKKLNKMSPDDSGPIPMSASERDPRLVDRLKKCLVKKTLAASENAEQTASEIESGKESLKTGLKSAKHPKKVLSELRSMKKAQNPDEKSDAQLGEDVEHLVERHFEENKEAERKEGHKLVAKDEKGVHPKLAPKESYKHRGVSPAGAIARYSGGKDKKMRQTAREHHKDVLSQMRSMPKPNLPKSEDVEKADILHDNIGQRRQARAADYKKRGDALSHKIAIEGAKEAHKEQLSHIKKQPKPNLPKSEKKDPVLGPTPQEKPMSDKYTKQVKSFLAGKLKKCIQKTESSPIGKKNAGNPVDMSAETKRAIREPADKPFKIQPRREGQANKPVNKAEDLSKKHYGFKAVEESARESGAKDPKAVAAAAGRKKFGKKKFQEMAAAGKKHHTKKSETLNKPYRSQAQRRWAHTKAGEKALGGKAAVHEWDEASKGKKLPEKVKKTQSKHDRCVEHIKENSPDVKNPHAVCVAEGVKPAKWKKK